MIGLAVLLVMAVWAVTVFVLLFVFTMKLKNKLRRWLLIYLLSPIIFLLPVGDEVIGAFQFKSLCSEKLFFSVGEDARGQTVTTMGIRKSPVSNMLLPVYEENWAYKSVKSDDVVLSWNVFHSEGGWLLQWLAGPKGGPFIFDGVCLSPNWKKSVFKDLNLIEVDNGAGK